MTDALTRLGKQNFATEQNFAGKQNPANPPGVVSDTDFATRSELRALQRDVRALAAVVGQFTRRRANSDTRLGEVLRLIHGFSYSTPWTVGELLGDARKADRDLWAALDAIVARGNPAICLGRFFQRHAGATVDGFRLQRCKREGNAWLYVVKVESIE